MSDGIKSNLEPIEESDLNLAGKFGTEEGKMADSAEMSSNSKEQVPSVENKPEAMEKSKEKEAAYTQILSKVQKTSASKQDDDSVKNDAESVSLEKDMENKINSLINIAQTKGVIHAVEVARHLEDNYVLDELHDRLLGDELHKALIEKGLIKDI